MRHEDAHPVVAPDHHRWAGREHGLSALRDHAERLLVSRHARSLLTARTASPWSRLSDPYHHFPDVVAAKQAHERLRRVAETVHDGLVEPHLTGGDPLP